MFSTKLTQPSTAEAAKRICEMTPSIAGLILPPHVRKRVIAFSAERKFPSSVTPPALIPTILKGKVVSGDPNLLDEEEERERPYKLVLTEEERDLCGIF